VGGAIFWSGALIMLVNVVMTIRKSVSQGSLRQARALAAA